MPVKATGFSLLEMLIALAISSLLLTGAARFLPQLQKANLRTLMMLQLNEELYLMMATLEKAVRRAGYCRGACEGPGLIMTQHPQTCLLVRWDENSNGTWEGVENQDSDYYGYRLRDGNLEAQRGVASCSAGGWEKLNDPATMTVTAFQVTRTGAKIRLKLSGIALAFPQSPVTLESWLTAKNL
ncbi:prepilin peptidase-dependent protein [Erwinia psidii]|uniref:Prepilin peptidase-dependent protein n=1 Tax=Erwinia psidii TaxID=69224 RepID=A0A3N6SFI7_9GAMM|nr:prepilin peptidase-dependent protein [Erwinia psidii]MCX8956876.1 prepilin peptidase-dependent protein [Erwinia psidii]MCX8960313.1 prepilin peptidase-dependent protein [Erwinia psidii]MCX8964507.1 prepilin peptidase-dependent protein [Erwinia psidii]RQM40250.1 prepilin peptidase-dependent protein [Erwinia psidii]